MLKAVKNLVDGFTHQGNHTASHEGNVSKFYYFGNLVCIADHVKKEFKLDSCGHTNSPSTTRTLNDYGRHFIKEGYTLLSRE